MARQRGALTLGVLYWCGKSHGVIVREGIAAPTPAASSSAKADDPYSLPVHWGTAIDQSRHRAYWVP
jgi:hypothetical protein